MTKQVTRKLTTGNNYEITDKNGFTYVGRVIFADEVKILLEIKKTLNQNRAVVTAVAIHNPLEIELQDIESWSDRQS